MPLPDRFSDYIRQVNKTLDRLIPPDDAPPEPIHRAMRYSVFAGGKRLRPILCLAAAESLGSTPNYLLPVAGAIEMVHTYSLIHDDLPSMDNDDFRRGRPTSHKIFGEAIAILAGDALLTRALEVLAQSGYDPAIRCRLIAQLTTAAGTRGMIGGQVLDMISETKELTQRELEAIHSMKTAALIGFAAVSAPVSLGSGETVENAFQEYGTGIGLAFQIIDDILDVESTSEALGKTAGRDRDRKKVTYPSLLGVEESRKLASKLVDRACNAVSNYDPHSYLSALAHYFLDRSK